MPHFICIVDGVRSVRSVCWCVRATAMLQIEQNRCWNSAKMKICGTRIDIQLLFFNFYHSLCLSPRHTAHSSSHTHSLPFHFEFIASIWFGIFEAVDTIFRLIYIRESLSLTLRLTTLRRRRIIHRNLVSNYYYYCMNGMPRQRTVIKWHRALWLTDAREHVNCAHSLCGACTRILDKNVDEQAHARTHTKFEIFNWNALVVEISRATKHFNDMLDWWIGI